MRVLAIVHQADAGPGVFTDSIRDAGATLDYARPGEAAETDHDAVVIFGGAMHPDQDGTHGWLAAERTMLGGLLQRGTPVLGVCLGAQLLAQAAGARAARVREPEIGWYEVEVTEAGRRDRLIGPLGPRFHALEWHSYGVELPAGAAVLARSAGCIQAYRIADHAWGIQFHAEVTGRDFGSWLDTYETDDDAVAMGLDPDALRAVTEARMAEWNALGRGLCARFLQVAAERVAS